MIHLKIELNMGIPEQVPGAVILKLYNVVTNNTLDNTSHLLGNLNTDATYQTYIDVLTDRTNNLTKDLYITATKKYIVLGDDEFLRVLLAKDIGDGVGVTSTDLASITNYSGDLGRWIYNGRHIYGAGTGLLYQNTSITNLDGLQYFTGLTAINGRFAMGCTNLVSVTTPSSLTSLSDPGNSDKAFMGAFRDCSSLTNVTLNEGLLSILCRCFKDCTSLLTLNIPSTVTTIGELAFHNCTSLLTITGTSNVTTIDISAFNGCSTLRTLPSWTPSTILDYAFYQCVSLTTIDLSNVTSIGNFAFLNCTLLSSVGQLNPNLTSIPCGCFKDCTSLTSIDLSNISTIGNLQDYEVGVFLNCTGLLTVTGLSSIDYIGPQTFKGCSNLGTGLDLVLNPTGNVGSESFLGTAFKSVTVNGPNCTSILDHNVHQAFYNMANCVTFDFSNTKITQSLSFGTRTSMKTVIYPSTFSIITWDGWGYYNNNDVLQYYIILATTPPTYENATYCKLTNGNFYVPDSAVNDYKSAWPQTGYLSWDIHAHIKPLSELPAGVWTTGLASQYLTPALLATS